MAPLAPLFEFQVHPTRASLEAPLGRSSLALEVLAKQCDDGSAYDAGILKIRGKLRLVAIPKAELDSVQRRVSQVLYPIDLWFGASPHGYVARRSPLTNARPHTGARFLQKFDIKDFFSNISRPQVEQALTALGFGAEAASVLSRLTCCRGRLPLGARTSPRLSNMVLIDVDDQLELLAEANGLVYTRYADDLTFSGPEFFDVTSDVEQTVIASGFELNRSKSRQFKHGQPMFVTGLSVEDATSPRVRKRVKARLRQEFYYIEKYGLEEHAEAIDEHWRWAASRLAGQYHYCRTVEPEFAARLSRTYPAASALVVPVHADSRVDRAQRHRRELVSRVLAAPPQSLAFYAPSVSLFDKSSPRQDPCHSAA